MTEKSLIGSLFGRKSKGLTTVERLCPAGKHALDPGWSKCPYCEAESGAKSPSRPQTEAAPKAAGRRSTQIDPGGTAGSPDETRVNAAAAVPARKHTMVNPQSGGSSEVERHAGGGRRLMGILTTFTWSRLGALYKLYDGRNYAGSGNVSANNNVQCNVYVPEDGTMSGSHFLILFQGSKVIISDTLSTNGTFVNGDQIDTRGIDLPDNAVIKAGATVFVFQRIRSAPGAPVAAAPAPAPSEERQEWRPGSEDELA